MYEKYNVFALEKYLIHPDHWYLHKDGIPQEQWEMLMAELKERSGPIGLGYTKETGYYILASGQGPFIVWMETK